MTDALLNLSIMSGPAIVLPYVVSAALAVYLMFKKRTLRWALTVAALVVGGAAAGWLIVWITVDVVDLIGTTVNAATYQWISAVSAGILLAVFNLWDSRWWRKVLAVFAVVMFVLSAILGINAAYGIQTTVGSFFHISTAQPVALPPVNTGEPATGQAPVIDTWQPPSGMPEHGVTGLVPGGIPNTVSGFDARGAEIYLPPAALIENAPRLPLVIFMMGSPGDPDADIIAEVLDEMASQNNGLAPIALVIDQLSAPFVDPLCIDSALGNAETYVMQDVVPWAASNLNVRADRTDWTIAGYSNGGQCATYFGSKYPETFGSILAASAEEFAGSEHPEKVLEQTFDGNQQEYDAIKPANVMASMAPYTNSAAVFTIGSQDSEFLSGVERLASAADLAGMMTTLYIVPDGDHGISGLAGGLEKGFTVLYPRMGLAQQ